jgi:hypothetical protein
VTDEPTSPDEAAEPGARDAAGAGPEAAAPEAPEPEAVRRSAIPSAAYTARAQIARDKGLPGMYIEGGEDPDLHATLERERPYTRLLVGMVLAIVLGGFVLGVIGFLVSEVFGV